MVDSLLLLVCIILCVHAQSSSSSQPKALEDKVRKLTSKENYRHLDLVSHEAHGKSTGNHDKSRRSALQDAHTKSKKKKDKYYEHLADAHEKVFAEEFSNQGIDESGLRRLKDEAYTAARGYSDALLKQEDAVGHREIAVSKGRLRHGPGQRSQREVELNKDVAEAAISHMKANGKVRAAHVHVRGSPK